MNIGKEVKAILKAICDKEGIDLPYSDVKEALLDIHTELKDDFYITVDGYEFRIIAESAIWEIYVAEIRNIVEECYSDVINLDKVPAFIAVSIDWEKTAQNAFVDGYGHTFASYDGEEMEVAGYWIFRVN